MVVVSRCFPFRLLITQAQFEKVFEFKTRQVYFIRPFLYWLKLGKSLQISCVNFFGLKLTLRQKSVFWKASFAKQELITCARLRVEDFATGKNFSFNQCHNKDFFFFSQQLCKPSTSSQVRITVSKSPNPSRVYIRLCKHGKRSLLLKCHTNGKNIKCS